MLLKNLIMYESTEGTSGNLQTERPEKELWRVICSQLESLNVSCVKMEFIPKLEMAQGDFPKHFPVLQFTSGGKKAPQSEVTGQTRETYLERNSCMIFMQLMKRNGA